MKARFVFILFFGEAQICLSLPKPYSAGGNFPSENLIINFRNGCTAAVAAVAAVT